MYDENNPHHRSLVNTLARAIGMRLNDELVPAKKRHEEPRYPKTYEVQQGGITREQHEAMRNLNPGYWTAAGLRHATFVRIDFFSGRPVAFYRFSYVDPRDGTRWTRDVRWGFKGGVLQEEKQYPARMG
jgi:hypothetical protein